MTEDKGPRRRFVPPGWRALAIGCGAAGLGIIALVTLLDPAPPASGFSVATGVEIAPTPAATDPLMAELLRCRSVSAGTNDATCREAWEANRRRFLGESRSFVPPTAVNDAEER